MPPTTTVTPPSPTRRPRIPALVALVVALALTAAACGEDTTTEAGAPAPQGAAVGAADDGGASEESGAEESGSEESGAEESGAEAGGLLDLELTDVDGEVFTLADYAGTPVLVENFATWCSNCRAQLVQNQEAAAADPDLAFVALSVETDIDPAEVAAYAADNGFSDIRFAVLTPEQLAWFADNYGNSAINPPSTPHWPVSAEGSIGDLVTGATSAADLPTLLGAA